MANWGDSEARRREILAAAAAQIEEGGFHALNIREIAKRAGVSLGTVYVYFRTKEEIFATLTADRMEGFCDDVVRSLRAADSLPGLFSALANLYLAFYRSHGRHLDPWAVVADPAAAEALPPEVIARLRKSVQVILAEAAMAVERLAATRGRALKADPLALPYVWITLTGLAVHFTSPRARALGNPDWNTLVRYVGDQLTTAILEEKT